MAYRKQLRENVKVGTHLEVIHCGITYEGEIVECELTAVQNADITLKDSNGRLVIIPIDINNLPVVRVPTPDNDSDELLEDEAGVNDTNNKAPVDEDSMPDYKSMEHSEIAKAAKKKGISLKENGKKKKRSEVINELKKYDKKHYKK